MHPYLIKYQGDDPEIDDYLIFYTSHTDDEGVINDVTKTFKKPVEIFWIKKIRESFINLSHVDSIKFVERMIKMDIQEF